MQANSNKSEFRKANSVDMKAKKALKVTGKIILVILILIIVVLIITSVLFRLRVNKAKDYLKSNGYYNLVSAGDYNVNVYSCGNENGRHTIVALAGYLDGEMYIGWRKMTTTLEEDNRLVFLDRAGYGVSDDYRGEMTAEHVVEHYRTALQNAGIQKPYVLMPHSMGGVYATYWASQYPDEIEAVMIIDGSEAQPFDLEKDALDLDIVKWMRRAGNLGLLPPMISSDYGKELEMLSEEEKPVSSALLEKTMSSHASTDEALRWQENCDFVWDTLETNDIPKMYLSILYAFHTKEQLINEGFTADVLRNVYGIAGDSDDEVYANFLETQPEKRRILDAYIEKMGNCQKIEMQGQHEIMFDKPDECGKILKDFLEGLDS